MVKDFSQEIDCTQTWEQPGRDGLWKRKRKRCHFLNILVPWHGWTSQSLQGNATTSVGTQGSHGEVHGKALGVTMESHSSYLVGQQPSYQWWPS